MIKQLLPNAVCLKCQGCCRFSTVDSVWLPCLLDEETQDLLDRDIPPVSMSLNKKINPIPNPQGDGFICAFLEAKDNKCKIYDFRPFECQLYPFLISLRDKKVILTVDLNCPYVRDNLKTQEFKEYTGYLITFLNSPAQLKTLKDNPQIIQAYEKVLDVIELKMPDET